MSDAPDEVEDALHAILSELGDHRLSGNERSKIERNCQHIHAAFGGSGPEDIYPEYREGGDE